MTVKSDLELKADVERELVWEPSVDAARIGVAVRDGAVTLAGEVPSYMEKWQAIKAAERVHGVRAVADGLVVKPLSEHTRSDSELAEAVANALRWPGAVPDTVVAKVEKGYVTLSGEVEWEYQREAAERAVRSLTGVRGVSDLITLKPRVVRTTDVKARIEEALSRQAALEARSIGVETYNGTVVLKGHAHSRQEADAAARAAWATPGVVKVENRIAIQPRLFPGRAPGHRSPPTPPGSRPVSPSC
jgi:osmotically-inducible protein OsmY